MGSGTKRLVALGFGIAAVGLSCWGAGPGRAEGLRDFRDGWLLSIPDRSLVLAPVSPRYPGGWWLGAGQGDLFSVAELPLRSVDCGWRSRSGSLPLSVGLSWERLGATLYREDTRLVMVRFGQRVRVEARARVRSWSVESEAVDSHLGFGLRGGWTFRMGTSLVGQADVWLHGAGNPTWHGRGGRRTLADVRLLYPGTGLALRLDQRFDGAPVISLEVFVGLDRRVGLGWRMDPETGSLGGGITARAAGLWLQSSHLAHPALGVTHRVYLGAGNPGAAPW